jgi:hypothetical protein
VNCADTSNSDNQISLPLMRIPRFLWIVSILIAVSPMVQLHFVNRAMPPAKADLVPVWIAARVALHHGNPYSADTTRQIQISYYGRPLRPSDNVNPMAYAYPAHTLILFSWIAPCSWPVVRLTFLILLPIVTACTAFLWLGVCGIDLSPAKTFLTLVLTLASWPIMWGIHQIQPTLVVAFFVAAGCYLYRHNRLVASGILFALATIKPQLVGLLIAWLCLSALLHRRWSFLVSFAAMTSVLIVSATWLVPGWIPEWRAAMADYVVYRHLKPDLQLIFGHWTGLALAVLIGVATVVVLWRGRKCSAEDPAFGLFCSLALAATVCLVPNEMAMIYNHALLMPACFLLLFNQPSSTLAGHLRRLAIAQIVVDYAVLPICALAATLTGPANLWDVLPCMDFLLPTLVTAFLIAQFARLPLTLSWRGQKPSFTAAQA